MPIVTTSPVLISDGTATLVDVTNAGPAAVRVYGAVAMDVAPGGTRRFEPSGEPVFAATSGGTANLTVTLLGGGGGGGGGTVTSVSGRQGAVTLTSADIPDLGTAALRNVGTGPGDVITGNHPGLTNARTPSAHAASHATGGGDPITIAQGQVIGLVPALTAKADLVGGKLADSQLPNLGTDDIDGLDSALADKAPLSALASKADDGAVVKLAGAQNIPGAKTFQAPVVVPAATAVAHPPRLAQVRLVLVWDGATYGTKPLGAIVEFVGPDEPVAGLVIGTLTPGDVWLQVDLAGTSVEAATRYVWHPTEGWQAIEQVGV